MQGAGQIAGPVLAGTVKKRPVRCRRPVHDQAREGGDVAIRRHDRCKPCCNGRRLRALPDRVDRQSGQFSEAPVTGDGADRIGTGEDNRCPWARTKLCIDGGLDPQQRLPQHRVTKLSPRPADAADLRELFLGAMRYW